MEHSAIYEKDRIKHEIAGNILIIGTHTNDAFLLKERSFIRVE